MINMTSYHSHYIHHVSLEQAGAHPVAIANLDWSALPMLWPWGLLIVAAIGFLFLGVKLGWWKSFKLKVWGIDCEGEGHLPHSDNDMSSAAPDFIQNGPDAPNTAGDLDDVQIPVFEVEGRNLETIVSWNRACREFYKIPDKHASSPTFYTVEDLFKRDKEFYEDDEIYEEHLSRYHSYRTARNAIAETGFTFATAFYAKCSPELSRFYARQWNRLGSIFIEKNNRGNWWVTILWVPVHKICNAQDFHVYLKTTMSGFGDKEATA